MDDSHEAETQNPPLWGGFDKLKLKVHQQSHHSYGMMIIRTVCCWRFVFISGSSYMENWLSISIYPKCTCQNSGWSCCVITT